MSVRAGSALRHKWQQEAIRAKRAATPRLAAQDAAEAAARDVRHRVFARYGRLVQAAARNGDMTWDEAIERLMAAQDRTTDRFLDRQQRIFGHDR